MAAFTELDWRRLDVQAIVSNSGLVVIEEARHIACRAWLERNGYHITTLDCRDGLALAVPELGRMLNWEAEFGYALQPDSRNLDALRDGFVFNASESGCVLEVLGADIAFQEDPQWLHGLLSIASEHSREHLARGQRFFTLLVLPTGSSLVGETYDTLRVPGTF